ncbi:MAG: 2-oxo acid dehydrogenase subunit E2 [Ktedonobacterales bacterium]|nr:2-oxo acid dehydrogenase subunit E2 [Ktedonobacterales bacterium]
MPYPKLRRILAMMYPSVQRKPMIHGLFEVDVTTARGLLQAHRMATGESLSFTAFILTCFAYTVGEDTSLQACRKGSRHLTLFDSVDVALPIEREIDGQSQPIIAIIRAANTKTFRAIHDEIRAAQMGQATQVWAGFSAASWLRLLPMVVIRVGWALFCWLRHMFPPLQKHYGGTVGLTAVGMFGKGGGWGIPLNDHALDVTVGGIAMKPGIVAGEMVIRDYLSITLSINHGLIDGAPAARFAQRFKERIEKADFVSCL